LRAGAHPEFQPAICHRLRRLLLVTAAPLALALGSSAALAVPSGCADPENTTGCTNVTQFTTGGFTNSGNFNNGESGTGGIGGVGTPGTSGTVTVNGGGTFDNSGSGAFSNGGSGGGGIDIEGGAGGNGTVMLEAGTTFSSSGTFANGGSGGGGINVTGGAGGSGTLTLDGATFNNSGTFTSGGNGSGGSNVSGGNGGAGTVTVGAGGAFTNSGSFANGGNGSGGINVSGGNGGAGTVTVGAGGAFTNSGSFANGGNGSGGINVSGGNGGAGTVTVGAGGAFTNTGTFTNGGTAGGGIDVTGALAGAGLIVVDGGGAFTNASGGTLDLAVGGIDNAGTFANYGTLSATGGGTIDNRASAIFNQLAGGTIGSVGQTVTFTNAGTLNIGAGGGALATTELNGNYVQTSSGILKVRADWTGNAGAGSADRLAVSGTAQLAGSVVVSPMNFMTTPGLSKTFTVLTAAGGITDSGLAMTSTAAVSYSIALLNSGATSTAPGFLDTLNVVAGVNFQGVAGGLTTNQNAVGGALNQVYSGGTTLPFVPTLMNLPNGTSLGAALDQLAPQGDAGVTSSTLRTAATFGSQLLSCRVRGEGDANAVIREGQCLWARGTGRHTGVESGVDTTGYRENAAFFSSGAQFDIGGPWRLGAGIGYESSRLKTDNGSTSDGERLHVGGVVKYNPGPLVLALGLTGGHGWYDNTRVIAFTGFNSTATSDTDTNFLSARLTAAYLVPLGGWYLKPQIEVADTWLHRDAYTETGGGGAALAVAGQNDWVLTVTPALEAGWQMAVPGIGVARPYVKAGLTWRDKDIFATSASFAAAPGSSPFTVSSRVDRTLADVGAGVDLISAGDNVLRLQYDGQFGDTLTQHLGSAKLSLKF
jgi:uncharacterized protein with beta-barrel porin domain